MVGADAQEIKEQGCDLEFGRKVRWPPIERADTRDAWQRSLLAKFNVKVWRHSRFSSDDVTTACGTSPNALKK